MSRRTRDTGQGLSFLPPPGWQVARAPWGHVLEAVLQPEPAVRHFGRITVLEPQHPEGDAGGPFASAWHTLLGALREQGTAASATDVVAWYRGRLACGMSVHWMGRDFYDPDPSRHLYAALYTVSLPGGASQSITATVVPGVGNPTLAASLALSARLALGEAMSALLGSVRAPLPVAAEAVVPADLVAGRWLGRSGNGGLHVAHAATGLYAGQQGTGHTVHHEFSRDGRYACRCTQFNMPQAGLLPGYQTDAHEGTWTLENDVIHRLPSRPTSRDHRLLVAGAGIRTGGASPRRILILMAPEGGTLVRPGLVPDGDQPSAWGARAWWCEEEAEP